MRQKLTTQKPSKLLPHLSDDAKELVEFARKIYAKLDNGVFDKLELVGSHGTYKLI